MERLFQIFELSCRAKVKVSKDQLEIGRLKYNILFSDNDDLSDQVRRLEEVYGTTVDEIEELRNNLAAAEYTYEHCCLPPGYDEINNEDNSPPYSRHKDDGIVELTQIERVIRRQLNNNLMSASVRARDEPGYRPILDVTRALAKGCSHLRTILKVAYRVTLTRGSLDPERYVSDTKTSWFCDMRAQTLRLMQSCANPHYVAGRVVALILEMLWRTAAVRNIFHNGMRLK